MIVHRCACAVKYNAQGRDKEGRHQVTSGMEAGIAGTKDEFKKRKKKI